MYWFQGRMAVCNLASEGLNSNTTTPDQAQRKLYIGGLSPETTSELLLSFFERHGEIEEGSVAYDKDSDKSRWENHLNAYFATNRSSYARISYPFLFKCSGFGFVTYKTVEAAKKALDDPQKMLGVSINYMLLFTNDKTCIKNEIQNRAVM